MITITYIITVYNKEKYIANVIKALKNIQGNFRKEFIIIDDGSTDNSRAIIESAILGLPKTIVVSQKNQGPAIAVNQGIALAHGDYVHFTDGDDIIAKDATEFLLGACKTMNSEVALGLRGNYDIETNKLVQSKREGGEVILIDSPIKAILEGKIPGIRRIGSSGSLVRRSLLEKISGADTGVFVQDLSISLRCAKYSKFAFLPKTTSYSPSVYTSNNLSHNKEFEAYSTLLAIANFMRDNEEIAEQFKIELYRSLCSTVWKIDKYSLEYLPRYLLAKFIKRNMSIEDLQELYNKYIARLL
ncbi:MAG: glycosyltransferase [Pseudomonadota bacterium]